MHASINFSLQTNYVFMITFMVGLL